MFSRSRVGVIAIAVLVGIVALGLSLNGQGVYTNTVLANDDESCVLALVKVLSPMAPGCAAAQHGGRQHEGSAANRSIEFFVCSRHSIFSCALVFALKFPDVTHRLQTTECS